MDNLQALPVALDPSTDDPLGTGWHTVLEVLASDAKEHELDVCRLVRASHLVRKPRITRGQVIANSDFYRCDTSRFRILKLWAIASIDSSDRQIEYEIEEPCAGHARDELLQLRTDAGERWRFAEQRKENRRAHHRHVIRARRNSSTPALERAVPRGYIRPL